jgi:ankyrin repeat protein
MQCLFTHARDKFDVNYRMDDGCTALHVAVLYEFPGTENNYENPCLHLLLKNGANINCGNTCKEGSALHLAIKNEYMANASYLLQQRLAKFDFGERDNY